MENNCLICNKPQDLTNFIDNTRNSGIFVLICQNLNVEITNQWNFEKDTLPFCYNCLSIAYELDRLNKEIELIKVKTKENIEFLKSSIRESANNNDKISDSQEKLFNTDLDTDYIIFKDLDVLACNQLVPATGISDRFNYFRNQVLKDDKEKQKDSPGNINNNQAVVIFETHPVDDGICDERVPIPTICEATNNNSSLGSMVDVMTHRLLSELEADDCGKSHLHNSLKGPENNVMMENLLLTSTAAPHQVEDDDGSIISNDFLNSVNYGDSFNLGGNSFGLGISLPSTPQSIDLNSLPPTPLTVDLNFFNDPFYGVGNQSFDFRAKWMKKPGDGSYFLGVRTIQSQDNNKLICCFCVSPDLPSCQFSVSMSNKYFRKNMAYHIKKDHYDLKKCPFPKCTKRFSNLQCSELKRHLSENHKPGQMLPPETPPIKLFCSQCGKDYKCKRSFKEHEISCTNKALEAGGQLSGIQKYCILPLIKKEFSCKYCFKIFPRNSNRQRHENEMHLKSPTERKCHFCSKCSINLSSKASLTEHNRMKHNEGKPIKMINCPSCIKCFPNQARLNKHIKSIHSKVPITKV